ncbi:serine hydrolase [Nibribacter ruber]|uniref:Serine hydrolase n=1 Tax=Nibribacter ruber TaxID=2698458 RepID=A0A6P1NWF4_9BACT|nr:serine hydrolase domain-containing protein [Nibribacter ruber]QHL88176.1 serine hydrolase [Nibribacter ruber]
MTKRFKKMVVAFLLLSFPFAGVAQKKQPFNKQKMDSLLSVLESKDKLMGAVAIYQEGKPVYNRSIGYAMVDGNAKEKATTATRYRIGSISKTFTATLILQLIEEKKLALNTPLSTFFPEFENASAITVEHLLNQHSGLMSFTSVPTYGLYMTQPKTQADMLAIMASLKPIAEPGAKYDYSNTNYVLLGYIVERVTKKPYAQVLQEKIVDKLKLKDTYYGGKIDRTKKEAASFKFINNQWSLAPETDMSIPHGAGAIVSTTKDLAVFINGLFAGKLISMASLEQMKTIKDGYGLGLVTLKFDNQVSYGHGGIIDGFNSMISYFPEQKLTMATTFNGLNINPSDAHVGILSIAFNKPYKVPTYAAPKNLNLDLTKYEGTFVSQQFPLKITMRKEGELLMSQAQGQSAFALEPRSSQNFVFEPAQIEIEFKANEAGVFDQFTLTQGAGKYHFTKE